MVTDLQCPVLQSSELRGKPEAACSAGELLDWLGAVFSNADLCVRELWGLAGLWLLVLNRGLIYFESDHVMDINVFSLFFCDRNNEPSNFISTYCCPQPSTVMAKASLCTITGFILPEKICLLLEQLW